MKEKVPDFTEVNCDAVEIDEEFISIKDEHIDDVATDDSILISPESRNFEDSATQESEKIENDFNDPFGIGDFGDDSINHDSDSDHVDKIDGVYRDEVFSGAAVPSNKNKEFDHLISEYLNMVCEICEHPFETLSEAGKHYRSQHNQEINSIKAKCCQRNISLYGARDHIQFHLNPEYFKYA